MTVLSSSKIASMASNSHLCKFVHAVTLTPALSAINGLRSEDRGAVNIDVMIKQHRNYIDALKSMPEQVTELNALAEFPDAQFVEDTALCLPGVAIMMRPGAASRRGE